MLVKRVFKAQNGESGFVTKQHYRTLIS